MNAPPPIGFLGRTFGWTGSRREWLTAAGLVAWLVAGAAITRAAPRLTAGEVVLAYAGWLLLLGVAARDAVRNLFGPVFFYDLVRVGRRRLTFGLRLVYAVGMSGFLALMYLAWLANHAGYTTDGSRVVGINELSQFGTTFFETVVVIQFVVAVLLTPVYVAGTICLEKERKTLEFLLATDLRNREIVFGKLASRLVTLLMFVLLGLPILAVIQLFGGVDPSRLLMAVAATVVTVVGLAALSIWYSTMLKKARDAIMLTYLTYLAYGFASLFAAAFANFSGPGWWSGPISAIPAAFANEFLGPVSAAVLTVIDHSIVIPFGVNDLLRRLAEGNIGWQLMIRQPWFQNRAGLSLTEAELLTNYVVFWAVASAVLLGHAVLRLRAVALRQSYGPTGGTRSRKKKVATLTGTEKVTVNEAVRRFPPVGDNPVFWKEVFVDAGGRRGWAVRIISVLIVILLMAPLGMMVYEWFFGGWAYNHSWYRFTQAVNGWVRVVTGVVTTLLLLAVTVRGAGAISGEKDKDSWISLLGTPLSADEILLGKWWGCVLGVRRIYLLLIVVWSIGLALGAMHPASLLLVMPLVALFVSSFSLLGLWFSMTARNTMVATVQAFFAALFGLGGYWAIVLLCCALPLSMSHSSSRDFEPVAQVFAALSPPLVTGWSPLLDGSRDDLDLFAWDNHGIGLVAPVVAVGVWVGFTLALAAACRARFRRLTNREPQPLFTRPPVPAPAVKTNPYE